MKKAYSIFILLAIMISTPWLLSATETIPTQALSVEKTHLQQVPEGSFVLDEKTTYQNLEEKQLQNNTAVILLRTLHERGYIKNFPLAGDENPDPEGDPTKERIPTETVKSVYDSLFGPGSFDRRPIKRFITGFGSLESFSNPEEYVYYEPFVGGDSGQILRHTPIVSAKELNGSLIMRVRFASLYRSYYQPSFIEADSTGHVIAYVSDSVENALKEGVYDEYLPIYEIVFKSNGDGTYYWESTEMIEAPKTVPESLGVSPSRIESSSETKEPPTDDPVTDVPATDLPVETASKSSPTPAEKQNGTILWFFGGIGVGIITTTISTVLIQQAKRKKK